VYCQWLRRQYAAYINALVALLTDSKQGAGVQAAALAAGMEAVRTEAGVGVFSNDLYARLLTAATTAEGVKSEVRCLCSSCCVVQVPANHAVPKLIPEASC
jgi:phosphoglycolate phosphatase-like HAD superfamily hydrolase